jgi:protein TonB
VRTRSSRGETSSDGRVRILGATPLSFGVALGVHLGLAAVVTVIGLRWFRPVGERTSVVVSVEQLAAIDDVDETLIEAERANTEPPLELDEPLDTPPLTPPRFADPPVIPDEDEPLADAPAPTEYTPPPDLFARPPQRPLGSAPKPVAEPIVVEEPAEPPQPPPEPAPPVGEVEAPPVALASPSPAYPTIARRRGWEGSVEILMVLDENGRVVEATIASSSGHAVLDEAARGTVLRSWRYVAGAAGRTVRHRFTFALDGVK